jgi:hypothetical protein
VLNLSKKSLESLSGIDSSTGVTGLGRGSLEVKGLGRLEGGPEGTEGLEFCRGLVDSVDLELRRFERKIVKTATAMTRINETN